MSDSVKFNFSRILNFKLPENWQEHKRWFYISLILLLAIVIIGVSIRTTNIPQLKDVTTGNYTLGPDLDPFLFLRVAEEIKEYGAPLNPDNMRYLGMANPYQNFVPYTIAYLYKFLSVFSGTISLEYAAIIFPVIFFGLSIIAFFFFVREIFHKKEKFQKNFVAVLASLIYAVMPVIQHRTTAGIPELESAGLLFFWLAFFLFLKAFNDEKKMFGRIDRGYFFALLAGISTSFMIYTWGGFRFIFLAFSLAALIAFLSGKMKKKGILIYSLWFIPSAITLTAKFGLQTLLFDITTSTFPLIVFLTLGLNLALKESFWNKIKEKIKIPLSKEVFSFLFIILAGLILGFIIKPGFVLNLFSSLKGYLLNPFGSERIGLTVAENAQPYVTDWLADLGKTFFWMFFVGTVILFYEAVKKFEKRDKIIAVVSFVLFVTGFIFSNYSSESVFNGSSVISQIVYFGGLLVLIFGFGYIYVKNIKNESELREVEFSYLVAIALIVIMIIASRGAIRLLIISSPVFIISAAFLVIALFDFWAKAKDDLGRLIFLILLLISIFLVSSTIVNYEKTTSTYVTYTVPSSYTVQWQEAMSWVRENTALNSIFVHWWDYGYWVQSIGRRPSLTDGGHSINYWDHLTGRYLLTTPYPETALSLMKSYNISYLLIDSTDLGKYPAYSSIGSDESGKDRYSSLPIIPADSEQTQVAEDSIIKVYSNIVPLDQDQVFSSAGGEVFLPEGKAYLIGIVVSSNPGEVVTEFGQPEAVFYYNDKQIRAPMRYLYYNEKLVDFGNGFEGGIYLLPTLSPSDNVNAQIDKTGSVIYLSPKVFNSLFAQVYLMNDPFKKYPTLELAHSQDNSLIKELRRQGFFGDFIYYNGFHGPIKIWEVNYPDNILAKEEFLKTDGEYAELDNLQFVR